MRYRFCIHPLKHKFMLLGQWLPHMGPPAHQENQPFTLSQADSIASEWIWGFSFSPMDKFSAGSGITSETFRSLDDQFIIWAHNALLVYCESKYCNREHCTLVSNADRERNRKKNDCWEENAFPALTQWQLNEHASALLMTGLFLVGKPPGFPLGTLQGNDIQTILSSYSNAETWMSVCLKINIAASAA